jgi:hypothetical protein
MRRHFLCAVLKIDLNGPSFMSANGIPPPSYPKRPAFFAMRFVRLMIKAVVATELGQDVFTLLSVIASTEDSRRYKSPVVFHNGQLMPLLGVKTWGRFDKARDAACEAGWLVHIPPGRGIRAPSSYWVTIPEGLEDIDDSPVDEGISEYSRGFADGRKSVIDSLNDHQLIVENAICNPVHYSTSDDQTKINPTIKRRSNEDQLIEHYIPIPNPNPNTAPVTENTVTGAAETKIVKPQKHRPDPPAETVLTFECVGETACWHLVKPQVDVWQDLFPSLDIDQQCRSALAWVMADSKRRKTANGMMKFLVGWFERSNDSGKTKRQDDKPKEKPRPRLVSSDEINRRGYNFQTGELGPEP